MNVGRMLGCALLLLATGACHRSGVGGECTDSSDCQSGLICSPNGTCVDPSTDAGGGGTDASGPGTDGGGPATDAAGPGSDASGPGTDGAPPGTDAGAGGVTLCTVPASPAGGACASGESCMTSECSMGRTMEGFCAEAGRPTCGGFTGMACPPGVYSSCLLSGGCGIADGSGVCVTPEERMMICAMQPSIWECP